MEHVREHAIILGSAIVISTVIVIARTTTLEAPTPAGARASSDGSEPGAGSTGRLPPRPRGPGTVDGGGEDLSHEAAAGEATKTVLEAQGIVKEAEELFQSSAGKEGRELELREAKKLLQRAEELLDALPENNVDAKNLRRRANQLHSDLLRVSGFD